VVMPGTSLALDEVEQLPTILFVIDNPFLKAPPFRDKVHIKSRHFSIQL
jgi:hypothetical protein